MKIRIKKSHRGRLTELKKRTGKSEAELYRTGSPATRKMITFARNARKWKHGLGGPLVETAMAHYYDGTTEPTQQMNTSEWSSGFEGYSSSTPRTATAFAPNGKYALATRSHTLPEVVVTGKDRSRVGAVKWKSARTPQLTAGDAMKGVDAATGPLLHWMQPSQYVGAFRDAVNGKNPVVSMLEGNNGIVSEEYAQEHPWLSTAFNLGADLAIPVAAGVSVRKPIPFSEKQAAAERMKSFIQSEDYMLRQREAGMSSEDISNFQNMVMRRLNDGNFPAYYANIKSNGRSLVLPKPFGGVYIKNGLSSDEFLNAFDHELAHYSTVNFTKGDNGFIGLLNKENPAIVESMLRHNENIVPYRPKSDAIKVRAARGLNADSDWLTIPDNWNKLNYFRGEQELRSNGYAMIQEAQRRGISTDDLVDLYTTQSTGEISADAPSPLRYMNYAYTTDGMKKFLKGLLSVSAPIGLTIENKKDEKNY